jgi:hypothetical protein
VLPTIHSRHTNNTVNKFRNKIYYRYFLTWPTTKYQQQSF